MNFSEPRRVLRPNSMAQTHQNQVQQTSSGATKNLRRRRQTGLIQAIRRLDVSIDQASRDDIARYIRAEYEREIGDLPLGFVAECGLGPPYVDHILNLGHAIIEHYASADVMPMPYAQARMLVRSGAYAYVEVYISGTVVPVLADGTAVI